MLSPIFTRMSAVPVNDSGVVNSRKTSSLRARTATFQRSGKQPGRRKVDRDRQEKQAPPHRSQQSENKPTLQPEPRINLTVQA